MERTGGATLNLKEAEKFSLLDRVAFLIALILPAGLHAAASVHLLTRCCSECLPDRLHGVGGEDKVTMNIRSFNSWPGALRALAAKQFKLSPKHPFGGSETLHIFRGFASRSQLELHSKVWKLMGVPQACIRRLLCLPEQGYR